MRTRYFALAWLFYFAVAASAQKSANPAGHSDSAQPESTAARKYSELGKTPDEFRKAIGSSQLVLSSDQKQYLIVPKPASGTASQETPSLWSYGYKVPSSKDSTPVLIQVGTKDDKPVYLPVWVSKDHAETMSNELEKLVEGAHWPDNPQAQSCSDGRECVKTCPDGKGGTYCCQWKCTFVK